MNIYKELNQFSGIIYYRIEPQNSPTPFKNQIWYQMR